MERISRIREVVSSFNAEGIIVTGYPNVFYYSNFTSEDGILYISKDKVYLITDSRYTLQANKECKGVEVIIRNGAYYSELSKIINGGKILFEDSIVYSQYRNFVSNIDADFCSVNIDYLRNVKDDKEVLKIKQAAKIASSCYRHILRFITSGMKESEIAEEMVSYMKKHGAACESFPTIVASGYRGALPHGVASNKRVKNGEFVTLDFGCVYKGYCSDITRSFMIGKASNKMKEIYNVVLEAQKLAIKEVRAGVKASYIDKIARDYIESRGYGEFFTHSTGHGVGVVVHDPIAVSKNSDIILEENMVITIEPGVYIPNYGGIRIEDDILVLRDGYEVLTKASKKLYKVDN